VLGVVSWALRNCSERRLHIYHTPSTSRDEPLCNADNLILQNIELVDIANNVFLSCCRIVFNNITGRKCASLQPLPSHMFPNESLVHHSYLGCSPLHPMLVIFYVWAMIDLTKYCRFGHNENCGFVSRHLIYPLCLPACTFRVGLYVTLFHYSLVYICCLVTGHLLLPRYYSFFSFQIVFSLNSFHHSH